MLDKAINQIVSELGKKFSDVTIAMHEAIARKAGLTGTDHKYLNILLKEGPLTAGDLAKTAGLTTGATTAMIDRFEKLGLVKREFSQNDRRKVIIVPDMDTINQHLGPAHQLLQEKIIGLVMGLTDAEKEAVKRYMVNAIRAMEEVTAELTSNEP